MDRIAGDNTAAMETAATDAPRTSQDASHPTETSVATVSDHATSHEGSQQRTVHVDDPDRTIREAELEESDGGGGVIARWRICRSRLANNRIRTSKYTLLTFLPRNLFEQFHRVAYIYFLILILINQIPQLAIFGRYISVIPLLSVLTVTAIKDAFEDWRRHRADSRENSRECLVYRGGQWCDATWQSIRVGELVHVRGDSTVPCDIVLLASSDLSGRAFVETMNLDGETNLKTRYAVSAAPKNTGSEAGLAEGRIRKDGGGDDGSHLNRNQRHLQSQQQSQQQSQTQKHKRKQQSSSLAGSLQQKHGRGAEQWHGWMLTCEAPSRNIYEFSGFLEKSERNGANTTTGSCSDAPGGPDGADGPDAGAAAAAAAAAAVSAPDGSDSTGIGFGKTTNTTGSGNGCGASSSTSAGSTTTSNSDSTCTSRITTVGATISPDTSPDAPASSSIAVGPLNVLLRGCEVRNTAWVEGVAVYTGGDCKVVLNSVGAQSKRSRIEAHLDRDMLILALLLTVLCLVCSIGMGVWLSSHNLSTLPYYGVSYDYLGVGGEAALNFFATLILLQVLVPISLYISMELVRIFQAVLMTWDREMCDEAGEREAEARRGWRRHWVGSNGGKWGGGIGRWGWKNRSGEQKGDEEGQEEVDGNRAEERKAESGRVMGSGSGGGSGGGSSKGEGSSGLLCRALNINEDLGQVRHVLTDKTGTLTENRMAFHSCSVAGVDLHSLHALPSLHALHPRVPSQGNSDASGASGSTQGAPVAAGTEGRVVDAQAGTKPGGVAGPGAVTEAEVEARLGQPPGGDGSGPLQLSAGLAREFADVAGPGARGLLDEFLLVLAVCNNVVPTRVSLTESGELDMHAVGEGEEEERVGGGESEEFKKEAATATTSAHVEMGSPDVGASAAEPTADVAIDDMAEAVGEVIEYQGESPDEVALVKAASGMGWQLVQRSEHHIVINVRGKDERYDVLGVHEFDSMRRRMSVVLRCPDGSTKLLVKGADSAVLSRVQTEEGGGAGEEEQNAAGTVVKDEEEEEEECEGDSEQEEEEGVGGEMVEEGEKAQEGIGTSPHHSPPQVPSLQQQILSATERHIHQYSQAGLRTLAIATRPLPPAALQSWLARYHAAAHSLSADRDAKLAALADETERGLQILGATAIEDRLQAGVPAALQMLREGGMKVWMLTGDKVETGVSIARSCGLVRGEDRVVSVSAGTERECERRLREVCGMEGVGMEGGGGLGEEEGVEGGRGGGGAETGEGGSDVRDGASSSSSRSSRDGQVDSGVDGDEGEGARPKESREHIREEINTCGTSDGGSTASSSWAMAIDGATLALALSPRLQSLFYRASLRCAVVLCCRVAPMQKAAVVAMVKQLSGELTLAIGDGANDVPMIQTAAIGVGIRGHEGRQAVMASDFAISQFRFLARLLLVHGHWNYHRMAYMIVYNLYKNTVFVLLLFWYLLQTAFSTTSAIGQLSLMFFSLTYTTIPTVVVATVDQTLLPTRLLTWPQLYGAGQREETYNLPVFLAAMLDATWQSLVLFLVGLASVSSLDGDMSALGQTWLVALVLVVTVHLAMDIRRWTWLHGAAIAVSILITVVSLLVIDYIPLLPEYGSFRYALATSTFWLDVLLMVVLAVLPRFCVKVVYQKWWPTDIQIAYEHECVHMDRRRNKISNFLLP
ncbi:hypothetical protein CLOP_g19305 [Closterium sp. NIES-67]|nr:hypothetical protein CLOP_g19305 [Closterium sp. NIES-67]